MACFAFNPRNIVGERIQVIMNGTKSVQAMVTIYPKPGAKTSEVEISCAPWKEDVDATTVYRPDTYFFRALRLEHGLWKAWMERIVKEIKVVAVVKVGEAPVEVRRLQDYLVLRVIKMTSDEAGSIREIESPRSFEWPIYFDLGQRLVNVDTDLLGEKPAHPPDARQYRSIGKRAGLIFATVSAVALGDWGRWTSSFKIKNQITAERQRKTPSDPQDTAEAMCLDEALQNGAAQHS